MVRLASFLALAVGVLAARGAAASTHSPLPSREPRAPTAPVCAAADGSCVPLAPPAPAPRSVQPSSRAAVAEVFDLAAMSFSSFLVVGPQGGGEEHRPGVFRPPT